MLNPVNILDIHINRPDYKLVVEVNTLILIAIAAAGILLIARSLLRKGSLGPEMELDGLDFGLTSGAANFKFKPNWTDRQVAYAIWVELSTRKIGLPIDFENDVVSEIFDSWFSFFGVTRELIKTIPVSKAADSNTQKIIALSVAVLNDGLRPHLTRWQARFRRWYDHEQAKPENEHADPQSIQSRYPRWQEMIADMEKRNQGMIRYRETMHAIVYGS